MKYGLGKGSVISKVTLTSLIITLGIVYGDIGTSPLYVIEAIIVGAKVGPQDLLLYGALSCIFWTLTLQTTLKYIIITLSADNNGEGGIFALYALTKKRTGLAATITMIGAACLLADGVITPAITVTSAVEGLSLIHAQIPIVPIVLMILAVLFFVQQFGTISIGEFFGPIMLIWFLMLGILGIFQLSMFPEVLHAINPAYAIKFLIHYPGGILLLGAVFLCTTGAEALYSDLGHCGLKNIRISWIFVKLTLVLNYFGQVAWIMRNGEIDHNKNPFFEIIPDWFLLPGIIIATSAAIIASQALISGSFTLISEGVSLNFWPKIKVLHPTEIRGQVYIPFINWFLFFACSFVVLFFKESANMEAAYGLSITLTMIMTTLLLTNYLIQSKLNFLISGMILLIYTTIEWTFLYANLHKLSSGGWFTIMMATIFVLVMYGWFFGRKTKNKYISFVNLNDYLDMFRDLKNDTSVPKIASNLVYIMKANRPNQIESKILYSIFNKQPKRADIYWFLHVNILNQPDTFTYEVQHVIPGTLIKIDFNLGFKIEPRINLYFKEVLEDLENSGEAKLISGFEFLKKRGFHGDFLFINIERIMTRDYKLSFGETFVMSLHRLLRMVSITDVKALGLDSTSIIEEKVPIAIERPIDRRIERI